VLHDRAQLGISADLCEYQTDNQGRSQPIEFDRARIKIRKPFTITSFIVMCGSASVQVQLVVIDAARSKELIVLTSPAAYEVIPGVPLGCPGDVFSPAFWAVMAQEAEMGGFGEIKLGESLAEEIAACLLGGFGMPAELGIAAYDRLRSRGLLSSGISEGVLEAALAEPFVTESGSRRYRFPKQKARYLALVLDRLPLMSEPESDLVFRDDLATLPGIGLKTASWVVRNRRRSDHVAVLDVHIIRAGRYMGLFSASMDPVRHYRIMEERFISLAKGLDVGAADLDAAIWRVMRTIGHLVPTTPYSSHVH
jgi:thermostable 8-oxoguanine DNA glycosylase